MLIVLFERNNPVLMCYGIWYVLGYFGVVWLFQWTDEGTSVLKTHWLCSGFPNGTIGNFTNGSQWYHWLNNGTIGLPMVPMVPLGEPMVPLGLPLVPI